MAVFDDSQADPNPGRYLIEISKCEEKLSKKAQDPMFEIQLQVASGDHRGKFLSRDWIMMAGRGAGLGSQKLKAFGFDVKGGDEIQASQLIGRRAWAHVDWEEWQGQRSLKVQSGSGLLCGYDDEETGRAALGDSPTTIEFSDPDDEALGDRF